MNKNPLTNRFLKAKPVSQGDERHWHNGWDIEIDPYAQSVQKAAKTLIETLDLEPNPNEWDACPIILLYKQAVELYLKLLIDEGSNFLPYPTDPLTLAKTHSLRWLAQIVGQIIKTVRWENEFRCEGIASLADFSALVSELEALDPVAAAVRSDNRRPGGLVPDQLLPSNVVRFAKTLGALIDLLDATADALASTWDQITSTAEDDRKPTIQ